MSYQLPIHRPKCQFVAGIDPDLDKSGLVIYDRVEKAWFCKTLTQHKLQEAIIGSYTTHELEIIVEAGWMNDSFFHEEGFPDTFDKWPLQNKLAYVAKAASRVGENFGVGKSISHIFKANGYSVVEVAPTTAKWNADLFKRQTGLTHGYNEEIRDACRTMFPFI
ncbi:hypothetical protein [Spirosoma sp. KNUC1025]|uniref:hypothetical protein n=1 Tax=Spirosoma sp. KNUC1025 TaxID=2894082 RepID=UPI003866AD08|nr:hypothetical protein LN737_19080 [Spirosoma sp. KNUC1025]